jgi:hypothetical protein
MGQTRPAPGAPREQIRKLEQTATMAKRRTAPSADKPVHRWAIYRLRGTPAAMIGIVHAADEQAAVAKAIEEFTILPQRRGRLVAQGRD